MILLGYSVTDAVACSVTPDIDGYHVPIGPLAYHVHPGATPDEWTALTAAIADGSVTVAPCMPPPPPHPDDLLAQLRAERDRRLAACDFTQLPDAPLDEAQRGAWVIYRQQLRDLPETITDPVVIEWPLAPEGTDA